jgi:hypothetical protein
MALPDKLSPTMLATKTTKTKTTTTNRTTNARARSLAQSNESLADMAEESRDG